MIRQIKFMNTLMVMLVTVLVIFSVMWGNGVLNRAVASAAVSMNSVQQAYEESNVMDDLKGSTVDGKPFNLKDYGFDSKKNTQVFSFVEYCYSYDPARQNNFGLYVYVYNPQGIKFVYGSAQNKIQFATGDAPKEWNKYQLQFLNACAEPDFQGLFLKYKIALSDSQKLGMLDELNSTERVYQVSGIELLTEGAVNATDYPATGVTDERAKGRITYRYSGYSKGWGPDSNTDTLKVTCNEGDVLRLEVHHTSYRQKGVTNGKDEYTQDNLNSVYFAVPKAIANKYGYVSEVHAEWRNAVTSWALLTGNYEIYSKFYNYVGRDIGHRNDSIGYSIFGAPQEAAHTIDLPDTVIESEIAYNARHSLSTDGMIQLGKTMKCRNYLTQLNWLFYTENGERVADRTAISASQLYDWYVKGFAKAVGKDYDGETLEFKDGVKIYKALFDSVDDEIKDYRIKADDKHTLLAQKWTQSWWEEHVTGGHHADGNIGVGAEVEAIHKVDDDDILTSERLTCDRLFISESDYKEFINYYNSNKAENYVYLIRLGVTDYKSVEATEYQYSTNLFGTVYEKKLDTNGYFFQETAMLDFDVIDVTFDNGTIQTVIPVVSSPMDIFSEATPPVHVTGDELGFWEWLLRELRKGTWWVWLIVIAVCLTLLILIFKALSVVFPILKPIWNGISWVLGGLGWLLSRPFVLIGRAFKNLGKQIKDRAAERKKRKERIRQEKLARKEAVEIAHYQNRLIRKEQNYQAKNAAKDRRRLAKQESKAAAIAARQQEKANNKLSQEPRKAADKSKGKAAPNRKTPKKSERKTKGNKAGKTT